MVPFLRKATFFFQNFRNQTENILEDCQGFPAAGQILPEMGFPPASVFMWFRFLVRGGSFIQIDRLNGSMEFLQTNFTQTSWVVCVQTLPGRFWVVPKG